MVAMPPALAAPSPAAMRVLASPTPVATEAHTHALNAEGDGAGQARVAMAAVAAEEEELVNVDMPKKRLHCAVCRAALKPPIYKVLLHLRLPKLAMKNEG